MNKLKTIGLSFVLVITILFQACTKDNDLSTKQTDLKVTVEGPASLQNVVLNDAVITFTEINSGNVTTTDEMNDNEVIVTLAEGSYDVALEGEISYELDGEQLTSQIRGYQNGLVLSGPTALLTIETFLHSETAGFVLQEIFFTGTETPEGKSYNGDKYFIIYNNSDEVQYADGLIISESEFLTTTKRVYAPDIMGEAFTAGSIVMIPGDGDEYPIEPGASFVVANNAIDHREYNANSLDLRDAEFELELLSSINVDNPGVTDLINLSGYMTMHNRGYKSYVLAKLEGTPEDFEANNKYTYQYETEIRTMSRDAYKIPNEWIIDAVNLSVATEFEWLVTDPSLDMSWTHVGSIGSDPDRFGKSVRRKVLSTTPDGRNILKDTNDSRVDFDAEVQPSLMK